MEESYGCEDDMGGSAGVGGFYESSAYDSYNATGYVLLNSVFDVH
jgi:hypothetical protein